MSARQVRRILGFLSITVVSSLVGHQLQVDVDEYRYRGDIEEAFDVVADPDAVRVAAMGYHTLFGDVIWVRTVLLFADTMRGSKQGAVELLRSLLITVSNLDPKWRSSHFYGGGMLRIHDDLDGSDEMYRRGLVGLPNDPFFPFSLGMNAYLHRDDTLTAGLYLAHAANLPGAPAWYRSSAARFTSEAGRTQDAIEYLQREIEASDSEEAIRVLRRSQAKTLHRYYSNKLTEARVAYEAATGQELTNPRELGELPPDPMNRGWVASVDGTVISAAEEQRLLEKAQGAEAKYLGPF